MIPVDQTRFGVGEGNCYTACVASILEVTMEDLAEHDRIYREYGMAHEARRFQDRDRWFDELNAERWRLGIVAVTIPHFYTPNGYSIKSGMSPRGILHSVVALNGKMVHDPHPSRAGLTDIEDYEVLVRVVSAEADS